MELVEPALKDVLSTRLVKMGITSGNVITVYMWLLKKNLGLHSAVCVRLMCPVNIEILHWHSRENELIS